jgi:TfoX/Sxy family transcriptional regulator of competence genes
VSEAAAILAAMAYDNELAARLRAALSFEKGITEKAMFGGLAFLKDGNMVVAASGQGGLMLRVDPAEGGALRERKGVHPMVMNGREAAGWLRVDEDVADTEDSLHAWLEHALVYVRTLPAKEHQDHDG